MSDESTNLLNEIEAQPPALLCVVGGGPVPLQRVAIRVAVRDLLCETEVVQNYRNTEDTNIEAVYTFPLPMHAVLLDLEVKLGDRTLRGAVIERKSAEEKYEDAVTSGDTAVMLQQAEDGLYTMNLGNLMAGETAEIRFRYALLLAWSGDLLRILIPTALAPRYGAPTKLEPHQVPEHSLLAEYPLDLQVIVEGSLATAALECASHAVTIDRSQGVALLRLDPEARLDRDFVLNIRAPAAAGSLARVERDGDGYVALASIRPELPAPVETPPRSIKIVVDCSGSMNGDSIRQARKALRLILDRLRPEDEFNIVAFGSAQKVLFPSQRKVSAEAVDRARSFVDALDADMGGTEMEAALRRTFSLKGGIDTHNVLLITDGEVWNHEAAAREACETSHRIFAIGVGSAVAEAVVRALSESTGGACELAAPREDMSGVILRQFARIYQPHAKSVRVVWPAEPLWQAPNTVTTVFNGDTVHVMAGFAAAVSGEVAVEMKLADGHIVKQPVKLSTAVAGEGSTTGVPRIAAARRIRDLEKANAIALALQYQLMSPHTAYFVLADRADKAQELPELRTVPQMLAAGWGGVGSVAPAPMIGALSDLDLETLSEPGILYSRDVPAFSHSDRFMLSRASRPGSSPLDFAEALNAYFKGLLRRIPCPRTIVELSAFGLPDDIIETLNALIEDGWAEAEVVIAFLFAFSRHLRDASLTRNASRAITKAAKGSPAADRLVECLERCLAGMSGGAWNWTVADSLPSAN